MKITFTDDAWADYLHWQNEDADVLRKVNQLVADIRKTPFPWPGEARAIEGIAQGVVVTTHHP